MDKIIVEHKLGNDIKKYFRLVRLLFYVLFFVIGFIIGYIL